MASQRYCSTATATATATATSTTSSTPSLTELNTMALDHFIYTPVSRTMISYLAAAAHSVIQCDPTMMPPPPSVASYQPVNPRLPPTPPETPPPRAVPAEDGGLPSLEEFITQLVVSSNVQVPTLMSTLVYLNRLKSRLQPMAKGLRCTTHRIFLASLILAAKYLNDSSPKNKHWANYSVMGCAEFSFGFSRTEVNLMEKQLLFLLDWDLRITVEDLHRELDPFLAPIREDMAARIERRERRKAAQAAAAEERRRREEELAAAWVVAHSVAVHATPPTTPNSRNQSRSVSATRATRQESPDSLPSLSSSYGSRSISSSHSYASSLTSSQGSEATTPLSTEGEAPYIYGGELHMGSLYEPPVEIVLEQPKRQMVQPQLRKQKSLLPYEISPEDLRDLQDGGSRVKRMRGMLGRVFGSGVAVR